MEHKIQRLENENRVLKVSKNDGINTQLLEQEQTLQEKTLEVTTL